VACGQRIRRLARMRVKSVLSRAVLSDQGVQVALYRLLTQYALRPNLQRRFDTISPLRAALAHRDGEWPAGRGSEGLRG
jgi:hypothetical protein